MTNVHTAISKFVRAYLLLVFFGLIVSLPVMVIWNLCLVPALIVVKPIGWLQAWGIMFLCNIFFKTTIPPKN